MNRAIEALSRANSMDNKFGEVDENDGFCIFNDTWHLMMSLE